MDNLHKKVKRNGGPEVANKDNKGIDMVIRKIQNARQSMGQPDHSAPSVPLVQQDAQKLSRPAKIEMLKQDLLTQQKLVWQQLQILKLLRMDNFGHPQPARGIISG